MTTTNQAIGIMGGTFNPIHNGHIETANYIADYLALKQINLMPCKAPVHKPQAQIATNHRCNMLAKICQHQPLFQLDLREINRKTDSYTLLSLQEIKLQYPEQKLYFIVGMDSLLNFTSWYQWQAILELCHLVVAVRPGYQVKHLAEPLKTLIDKNQQHKTQTAGKIILVDNPSYDISSTDIRQALSKQQAITKLVPSVVADYITQHQLYR